MCSIMIKALLMAGKVIRGDQERLGFRRDTMKEGEEIFLPSEKFTLLMGGVSGAIAGPCFHLTEEFGLYSLWAGEF